VNASVARRGQAMWDTVWDTCKTGGQPHMRGSLGWVQLTFPASIVCIKLAASLHEGIPLLLPLIKLPLTAGRGVQLRG